MPDIGIIEMREIIAAIRSGFNYDFGNYALTSLKQRLEWIMGLYNIDDATGLIAKLHNDRNYFDVFLHELNVPSTEMFRDPSVWRWLKDEYFRIMASRITEKIRIWLPACVSGGELFSLAILLSEAGMLDKVQIIASCQSNKSIELIRSGFYNLKKMEVSEENYKCLNTNTQLSKYIRPGLNWAFRDTRLIQHVEFNILNINFDNAPKNIRLILFRNSMIYYNFSHQDRILHVMFNALSPSGNILIGIREKISGINTGRDFEFVNETESVYRKRNLS